MATDSVSTNGVVATSLWVLQALVDINAGSIGLGSEALRTSAIAHTTRYRDTLSTFRTFVAVGASSKDAVSTNQLVWRLTLALGAVAFFAEVEGISVEAGWARALVATGQILTNRVDSASCFVALGALVDVATVLREGVARITLTTNAHIRAAGVCDAFFPRRAWVFIVTLY